MSDDTDAVRLALKAALVGLECDSVMCGWIPADDDMLLDRLVNAVASVQAPVYRVVQEDGTPVNSRSWSNRGHAATSLRHSGGTEVQEGQVTWPTVNTDEKESHRVPEELVLPLEHPGLGSHYAPDA